MVKGSGTSLLIKESVVRLPEVTVRRNSKQSSDPFSSNYNNIISDTADNLFCKCDFRRKKISCAFAKCLVYLLSLFAITLYLLCNISANDAFACGTQLHEVFWRKILRCSGYSVRMSWEWCALRTGKLGFGPIYVRAMDDIWASYTYNAAYLIVCIVI